MEVARQQILVIDGDETTRASVVELLSRAGLDSIASEDGFEAVGRIEAGTYAAILLDVRESPSRVDRKVPMGFAVLEHLHRNKPEMIRRVIVMTANAPLFVSSPWFDRVGGFIRKPVDADALVSLVRERLDAI